VLETIQTMILQPPKHTKQLTDTNTGDFSAYTNKKKDKGKGSQFV